ncbi:hypothetical protein ACXVUM_17130 [Williamsia sp. SKLECPSW1]
MEHTGTPDAREALRDVMAVLADLPAAGDEAEAIDLISLAESVKAACAATQAEQTLRLQELRSAAEAERGVPVERRCRGLSAEVALARRVSGNAGGRYLGFARAMGEMPNTFTRLREGSLSEWRATILVRETGYLQVEDRRAIDNALCADPATLDGVGDRALAALARQIAYSRDPHAVVDRNASAPKDRRVSLRPKPDAMVQLSALLPMTAGIAAYAALKKQADLICQSDDRTHAQVMADTLLRRLTGVAVPGAIPLAVDVVVPADVLVGDGGGDRRGRRSRLRTHPRRYRTRSHRGRPRPRRARRAEATVRDPRDWGAGRDGVEGAAVPDRPTPISDPPRCVVSDPVLRRPDRRDRPRPSPSHRRADHR